MRIGIIQGSSQKDKNEVLAACVQEAVTEKDKIYNFGVFANSEASLSYIETAFCVFLLLESNAVDFIVTGCSSGQGMMLACNSYPNVVCGYVNTVTDAFLFGRINDGNAISYPLGVNWGWAAEINLKETLKALFHDPFGIGYPQSQAKRKQHDTKQLKSIQKICKRDALTIIASLDQTFIKRVLSYDLVYDFIMENGTNKPLQECLKRYK